MIIKEKKDECNSKYAELLSMLENDCDMNKVHKLMIEIAESLIGLSRLSSGEEKKCMEKAIFLVTIAKGINASTKREDLYLKLTGTPLNKKRSDELENIQRELNGLRQKDKGLINKGSVTTNG